MTVTQFDRGEINGKVSWFVRKDEGVLTRIEGEPWGSWRGTDETVKRDAVTPLPACTPGKILAVGANFAEKDHPSKPATPSVFQKAISSLCRPRAPIEIPWLFGAVALEGELGIVVNRRLKDASISECKSALGAFVVANDVSGREPAGAQPPPLLIKGCDTFLPVSSSCVTGIAWNEQTVTTKVDGKVEQRGKLRDMFFTPEEVLSFLSTLLTVETGDLLLMGTPSPKPLVRGGEEVEVSVSSVGSVTNRVIQRKR